MNKFGSCDKVFFSGEFNYYNRLIANFCKHNLPKILTTGW